MQLILGDDSGHRAELVEVRSRILTDGNVRVVGTFRANFVKRNGDHVREALVMESATAANYPLAEGQMIQSMLVRLNDAEPRENGER